MLKTGWLWSIFFTVSGVFLPLTSSAQITPAADGTGTTVTVNGQQFDIGGGTFSGDGRNLFHIFREFGLNQGEIANFLSNPNVRNILTGVNGGNPSYINGLLQVTGGNSNLYLLNPAGIVFGPHASLNVPAAFHASTAQRVHFEGGIFDINGVNDYANLLGNPTGFEFLNTGIIINEGNLAVKPGQSISLMAHQVINTGTLSAPGGTITIQAVPETGMVRISQEGMLLSLEIPADRIPADGIIQAVDLPRLITGGGDSPRVNSVIHHPDGSISLIHDPTKVPLNRNTAVVGGTLDVSSDTNLGGRINVLGENIALLGANLNASGGIGGGTILVGGDYLGGTTGTNLLDSSFNAQNTFINSTSLINADALNLGDGGTVIAWADNFTNFQGFITARGGSQGGDGGFVETSGRERLNVSGLVDASAPLGNAGLWLLDPFEVNITDGATSGGAFDGNNPDIFTPTEVANIQNTQINTALDAGTSVTILGLKININAPITKSTTHNFATLTINSSSSFFIDDIFINAPIELSNGNLILTGRDIFQNANIQASDITVSSLNYSIANNITLQSVGGDVNISSANVFIGDSSVIDSGTGNITIGISTEADFGNNSELRGTGNLLIRHLAGNFSIYIGGVPGSRDAVVSSNIFDVIQPGFQQVLIGKEAGTGQVVVGNITNPGNTDITLIGGGGGILFTEDLNFATANLILNSTGLVTQQAGTSLTFNGLALLGSGSYTLTNPGNSFSQLAANTTGDITLSSTTALTIGTVNGISGVNTNGNLLNLFIGGDVNQTAPIQTGELGLTVTGGSVNLNNPNNQITTVAADVTGNFSLVNNGTLTVDTVNPTGINSGGTVFLQTMSGNLVLNQAITANAAGNSIVLVSGDNFINNFGPTALNAPNGRWLVYSTDPANNIFGGLTGSEQFSTLFPGDATFTGSGFLYSILGGEIALLATPMEAATTAIPVEPPTSTPATASTIAVALSENIPPIDIEQEVLFGNELNTILLGDESTTEVDQDSAKGHTTFFPGIAFARQQIASALDEGNYDAAVLWLEKLYIHEYSDYFQEIFTPPGDNLQVTFDINDVSAIQSLLADIGTQTGQTPALLYTFIRPGQLDILVITPSGSPIYIPVHEADQETLQRTMNAFNREVKDPTKINTNSYLPAAQQLYQWIMGSLHGELRARSIDTLLLSMDEGFRTLPMAALHSGGHTLVSSAVSDTPIIVATGNGQFLVEQYNLGLIPSINLIDTQFQSIQNAQVLAMGASEFTDQSPLPAVPVELGFIKQRLGGGVKMFNQDFTLSNLESQRRKGKYSVVHLATHGEFNAGSPSNSYIQFWNQPLSLSELEDIRLSQPITELLSLSACRTAVGSREAELGFAGLALRAGVKSAAASLWYVSDTGTLALMTEFYSHLETAPIKAEAMRQAQLGMLRGEVTLEGDRLRGTGVRGGEGIVLPEELMIEGSRNLSHPYFWSAFTLIGSPW